MLTFDEIQKQGKAGAFFAVGTDGRKYSAHFLPRIWARYYVFRYPLYC